MPAKKCPNTCYALTGKYNVAEKGWMQAGFSMGSVCRPGAHQKHVILEAEASWCLRINVIMCTPYHTITFTCHCYMELSGKNCHKLSQ